jgi:cytidylate kinase
MTIVTISRGSYSRGKEVAEKTAKELGYDCVSRDILLDASETFNIPEIRLVRAIHDAPSLLDRFTLNKRSYVTYIQSAFTERVKSDNVVYHGLAGHVFLHGIDHVLKVRIIADMEDRVRQEMQREGENTETARARITHDDQERRKWTQSLYGVDPWDPALYDMVIHIHRFSVDDAVEMICRAVKRDHFQATAASKQKMADLVLACSVKAALVESHPDFAVSAEYGNVLIYTKREDRSAHRLEARAKSLANEISGINNVEVHCGVPYPPSTV